MFEDVDDSCLVCRTNTKNLHLEKLFGGVTVTCFYVELKKVLKV